MTEYGRFADAQELLDLLARRRSELGLSNEKFDRICGFAGGQSDKYLGPTRLKSPTVANLEIMLTALGLSGTLTVDAAKVASSGRLWMREGRRNDESVRPPQRVSKALIRRAAPEVRRISASLAAHARWKKTTPAQRIKFGRWLTRQRKRR